MKDNKETDPSIQNLQDIFQSDPHILYPKPTISSSFGWFLSIGMSLSIPVTLSMAGVTSGVLSIYGLLHSKILSSSLLVGVSFFFIRSSLPIASKILRSLKSGEEVTQGLIKTIDDDNTSDLTKVREYLEKQKSKENGWMWIDVSMWQRFNYSHLRNPELVKIVEKKKNPFLSAFVERAKDQNNQQISSEGQKSQILSPSSPQKIDSPLISTCAVPLACRIFNNARKIFRR